jgi:Zn finger protein HypA/HybF involved in hydrogenase expression
MDGITVQTIAASIGSVLSLAKQVFELVGSAKSAEARLAYSELQKEMAELNSQFAELMNENTSLKDQLRRAMSAELGFECRDGLYFKPGESDPYCPSCYADHKTVRLGPSPPAVARRFGKYRCPHCNKCFGETPR